MPRDGRLRSDLEERIHDLDREDATLLFELQKKPKLKMSTWKGFLYTMDSSDVVFSVSLHGSGQHNSDSIMLEELQKTPNVSHDTNENAAKTSKS